MYYMWSMSNIRGRGSEDHYGFSFEAMCIRSHTNIYFFILYWRAPTCINACSSIYENTVVRPTLKKKQEFDKALIKKYHIASNFFFNSKIRGKVLNFRLEDQLQLTNQHHRQKSAYRAPHSTQTFSWESIKIHVYQKH